MSKNGSFIKKYDIDTGKNPGEGLTEKPTKFTSCIFHRKEKNLEKLSQTQKANLSSTDEALLRPNEKYEDHLLVVGQKDEKMFARWYDPAETEEGRMSIELAHQGTHFTDIVEIRKGEKRRLPRLGEKQGKIPPVMKNFVLASDIGRLHVFGLPPYLEEGKECEVLNAHHGAVTSLALHHDSSILVSVGVDGTVMVYRINAISNKTFGSHTKKTAAIMDKVRRRALQMGSQNQ